MLLIVTKPPCSSCLHDFFSSTMIPFVLKCESAYLLTQFPSSEGLVSIKHIRIILQSLLTQEQRHCSIILSEQQHHSLLSIQYLIMCSVFGHFEYKKIFCSYCTIFPIFSISLLYRHKSDTSNMIFDLVIFCLFIFWSLGDIGCMCQASTMLTVSSEYKNDLVCTQHAVSLTSFNFTARVGFITLLLSKCASVCVREKNGMRSNDSVHISVFYNARCGSSVHHLCTHTLSRFVHKI